MSRDPAEGVITWFAVFVIGAILASAACFVLAAWWLWHLVASFFAS